MKSYDTLERENRILRARLALYEPVNAGKSPAAPRRGVSGVLLSGCRSYPTYLWFLLRRGGLWQNVKSAQRVLRSTLFWQRAILLIGRILLGIETGALFLFFLSAGAILFPVTVLLSSLGAVLLSAIHARDAAGMRRDLRRRQVLLLDAPRLSPFALSNARDLAERGYTVLLIGAPLPRRFLSSRRLSPSVYALRPGFYFYLRRRRFLSRRAPISVAV